MTIAASEVLTSGMAGRDPRQVPRRSAARLEQPGNEETRHDDADADAAAAEVDRDPRGCACRVMRVELGRERSSGDERQCAARARDESHQQQRRKAAGLEATSASSTTLSKPGTNNPARLHAQNE
jgi:hypothetical protein